MTFKDFFLAELQVEKPIGVLMRFNIRRSESPDSVYIFVEGPSDKKFYSSTKIQKLQTALYFFSLREDFEDEHQKIVGKEAVLTCYSSLKRRDDIGESFKRCIFIIDRDYDPEIECSKVRVSYDEKERLSMTYGHSFENYFLEQNNLKRVFSFYSLSEIALKEYMEHFTVFAEKASKYFAALATVTRYYGDSGRKYRSRYSVEAVFSNDVLVDEGINISLFRAEYQSMMEYIQRDKRYMEFYRKTKKIIEQAPGLYLRGHNCYYHLEQYLAKKYRVYLSADCRKLTKIFNVQFNGYNLQTL